MMVKTALNSLVEGELQHDAKPTPANLGLSDMGQAGGKDSLARLGDAMSELRAVAAAPMLHRSMEALKREDFVGGGKWAIKALEVDERSGLGWYLLAMSRERAGDFANSVQAYEAALQLLPNHADVANDLGRLAFRMGMYEQAAKLFTRFAEHAPDRPDGFNNLASVLKEQGRSDEAIEVLKGAIAQRPQEPMLWNTLATILMEQGDLQNATTFFSEAVRLNPKFSKARYNLSQVKLALDDLEGALADCNAALKRINTAEDRQMMLLARASYQIAMGRLGPGFDDYEARLSAQFAGVTHFLIDRPAWKPGMNIKGKNFLVVAEQGLGDEVLFANMLPDIVERLGPEGKLRLSVERRLVTLFQRTFPDAEVTRHITNVISTKGVRRVLDMDLDTVELWAPMGSLLREYRRTHDAFPDHRGYLKADPERVAHWKKVLEDAPPGPKVGLLWKSAVIKGRSKFFSPFEQWESVLRTPGVSFVNLQYGDCSEELERAKEEFGVTIWQPPGIDLKEDLDDVAALCCAMDLIIGFSNATLNIGAACGAPIWLISAPTAWPLLGVRDGPYPWYPNSKMFLPQEFGVWGPVMDEVAASLGAWAAAR